MYVASTLVSMLRGKLWVALSLAVAVPLVGGILAAPHARNNTVAVGALTSSALQIASVGALSTGVAFAVE